MARVKRGGRRNESRGGSPEALGVAAIGRARGGRDRGSADARSHRCTRHNRISDRPFRRGHRLRRDRLRDDPTRRQPLGGRTPHSAWKRAERASPDIEWRRSSRCRRARSDRAARGPRRPALRCRFGGRQQPRSADHAGYARPHRRLVQLGAGSLLCLRHGPIMDRGRDRRRHSGVLRHPCAARDAAARFGARPRHGAGA